MRASGSECSSLSNLLNRRMAERQRYENYDYYSRFIFSFEQHGRHRLELSKNHPLTTHLMALSSQEHRSKKLSVAKAESFKNFLLIKSSFLQAYVTLRTRILFETFWFISRKISQCREVWSFRDSKTKLQRFVRHFVKLQNLNMEAR